MKILFQGDSITDSGRSRENDTQLGYGYATLVSAELGFDAPGKYEFVNKGIGGNRVVDVYSRINTDIINISPDVMSILIGVNDIWQYYASEPNGTPADRYEKIYDALIEETLKYLPDLKIMMFEPFVLRGTGTYMLGSGGSYERYDEFRARVSELSVRAKKIAAKYNIPFIPMQAGFDELCKQAPDEYWLWDGVHPTAKGHEFIKREWLKAFRKYILQED